MFVCGNIQPASTSTSTHFQRRRHGRRISHARGLLVYDVTLKAFFIYGKDSKGNVTWYNISENAGLWSKNGDAVYLSDPDANVGIGTTNPNKKLVIQADGEDDTLMEIRDKDGNPLMIVTPQLTKFNFKENAGASSTSGGFAVGRYALAKDGKATDTTLFMVTPDSTRVFTMGKETAGAAGTSGGFAVGRYALAKDGKAKGNIAYNFFTDTKHTRIYTVGPETAGAAGTSGGFAVGRYALAKGDTAYNFFTDTKHTRIYTVGPETAGAAGTSGGFAVGRYALAKGDTTYNFFTDLDSTIINAKDSVAGLKVKNSGSNSKQSFVHMTPENTFLGHESGIKTILDNSSDDGKYNSFIGYKTGYENIKGKHNVFIGTEAGFSSNDDYNVFIGTKAGKSNTLGTANMFLGYWSGRSNTIGNYNTFFGYQSGRDNISGNNNVFIGPRSGHRNTDGYNNLFLGRQSGRDNRKGDNNIYLGNEAGQRDTTGSSNICIGYQAGRLNKNGSSNICIGYRAGYYETGSDKLYISNSNTNRPIIWGNMAQDKLGFHGSVCIGDTLNGGGSNVLGIVSGTAPTGSITDGIILYSSGYSAELRVRDEAGHITTLSPHNFSLLKKSEPMAWSYYSENTETGQIINVDMLRAIRLIEKISGEKLVYIKEKGESINLENQEKETSLAEIIKKQQKVIEQLSNELKSLRMEQKQMKELLKAKN